MGGVQVVQELKLIAAGRGRQTGRRLKIHHRFVPRTELRALINGGQETRRPVARPRAVNLGHGVKGPPRSKKPTVLEWPFGQDRMRIVGIGTESGSRSQEVVVRSGFGLYGPGWLRRSRRLNPPGNPISNSRFPRSDGFHGHQPRRYSSRYSTKQRRGTCGLSGFRLIRCRVARPFQRRSPDKPDKHRPIRRPERVPVGPTEATARCAKGNTSGTAGRWFFEVGLLSQPVPGQRTGHRNLGRGGWAKGEAVLASVNWLAS